MLFELEHRLFERLLPSTGVVVEVGDNSPLQALREKRPKLAFHRLEAGERLEALSLPRIHLLQLNAVPPLQGVLATLRTGVSYLRNRRIDLIRFEYGTAIRDSGESLFDIAVFLMPFGYSLLRIKDGQGLRVGRVDAGNDDYLPATFYAVSARLAPLLMQGAAPDSRQVVPAQFKRFGLQARGVVHVGAHHGEELPVYKAMGFKRILFVEANPALAQALKTATANDPTVMVAHCAVADHDGEVTLRITSFDESSSILPLKVHRELYPQIKESGQVTVPARRLDTLLAELGASPAEFNYLHLDIQGAEYLALKGATGLLQQIDALTTEINFEELYEGCSLFDDLDGLLGGQGFEVKVFNCGFHASWGDAFYLRKRLTHPRMGMPPAPGAPVVTMSTLGTNGRYGNQLWQYAFLRLVAHHHGLRVQTSPWIGQRLFGHADPPVAARFPPIFEGRDLPDAVFPTELMDMAPANRELWGYFQCDTVHYAPHREFVRSLFQPVAAIRDVLAPAVERLRSGRTLVALHIRRGDYRPAGLFFAAPTAWYLDWLRGLWPTLAKPLLYIATDEPGKVLPEFSEYSPVWARDLAVELEGAADYPDFYVLSQAEAVGISNSSFSFFATLLNTRGSVFMRPNQRLRRLVAYDPWNAAPLLHREMGEPIPHFAPPPAAPPPAATPAKGSGGVQVHGTTGTGAPIISFKKPI